MQDLFLSGVGVPAISHPGDGSPEEDDFASSYIQDRASSEMTKAIASLPSLTSLRLRAVLLDVLPGHCTGHLSNLRQDHAHFCVGI